MRYWPWNLPGNLTLILTIFSARVLTKTMISKDFNQNIPAEIQQQWSRTTDNNCSHFSEFKVANVGHSRDNTGKKPSKTFGLVLVDEILQNIKTWMNRNAAKKQNENTGLQSPLP